MERERRDEGVESGLVEGEEAAVEGRGERACSSAVVGVAAVVDAQAIVQDAEEQRDGGIGAGRLLGQDQAEGGDGLPVLLAVDVRVAVGRERRDGPDEGVRIWDELSHGRDYRRG